MIALSVGHHPGAQGASFGNRTEHGEASEWIRRIAQELRFHTEVQIVPIGTLVQKLRWLNALDPQPVLAAELHFNSDESKRQHGCETLYCPGSHRGKVAAEIVQAGLAMLFPPSRGIKEGWYRMDTPGRVDYPGDIDGDETIDYFLRHTRCVALILEPEFIYNIDTIDAQCNAACETIARTLAAAEKAIRGMSS